MMQDKCLSCELPASHVLLPCRHGIFCWTCSWAYLECPLCFTLIQDRNLPEATRALRATKEELSEYRPRNLFKLGLDRISTQKPKFTHKGESCWEVRLASGSKEYFLELSANQNLPKEIQEDLATRAPQLYWCKRFAQEERVRRK